MEIYEVYAICIQPTQLKLVLPTSLHTEKGLEDERNHFLGFLKERYRLGMRYETQMLAWEDYRLYIDFSQTDEEDLETSWMSEIESIFEGQARVGNYSEFGGQQ